MDVRFKEVPFHFDGQDWTLRCNMWILADVQEENGGDFSALISGKHEMKSVLQFLAAMLNFDAKKRSIPTRYTAFDTGSKLTFPEYKRISEQVMELVVAAVKADDAAGDAPADEKNTQTSEV